MEKCKTFESCSAPICPLDFFTPFGIYLTGDPVCPFCARASKLKQGRRKSMPKELRELVPEHNIRLLRLRNQ